jgi:starvation-inducible DNA-binding protein
MSLSPEVLGIPEIGLSPEGLQHEALLLNTLLADEYLLIIKTKNYHWNIEGEGFHAHHLFLDTLAEECEEIADQLAERVRQLGHRAVGSMRHFLELTHLLEDDHTHSWQEMFFNLLRDHEVIIREMRKAVEIASAQHHDEGTSDMVTGLMEQHEKMAWMLRSHLPKVAR